MTFENFDELLVLMQSFEMPGWFSDLHDEQIVCFKVEYSPSCPCVSWAVIFTVNLQVETYLYGQPFSVVVSELTTPFTTNSFSLIQALFETIDLTLISSLNDDAAPISEPECLDSNHDSVYKLKLIYELVTDILENLTNFVDIKITENLNFISEQLGLISTVKEGQGFSTKTTILCSVLFTISPHAYTFLRNYGPLVLPHPEALKGICNTFLTNPSDQAFLVYTKSILPLIKKEDRDVIMFVDEIYIEPNSITTVLVTFMVKSVRGNFKEVVHIAPAAKINADLLYHCIKTVVEELEGLGFRVFCIVTNHTTLNCKAMSKFSSKTQLSIVYPHPVCSSRPLFYLFDSVELLKSFFGVWLSCNPLNYPDFHTGRARQASFDVLKELVQLDNVGYCPSLKALFPSSLERQSVRLALRIFNSSVLDALRNLPGCQDTADLIYVILSWWRVVTAKTANLQPKLDFLTKMLNWLDLWTSNPVITALSHSVYGLCEVTKYCLAELNLDCIALGKFQAEHLDKTCEQYRHIATGHYHISLKQLYNHSEVIKLKIRSKITFQSNLFGRFTVNRFYEPAKQDFQEKTDFPAIKITLSDYNKSFKSEIAAITYLTGHCCRAALKKLSCTYCKSLLVYDKLFAVEDRYRLVNKPNHKGLHYPREDVVNLVLTMLIVFKQFLRQNEDSFVDHLDKRNCLSNLLLDSLVQEDLIVSEGCVVHYPKTVTKIIVSTVSSTLVKGYCDAKNRTRRFDPVENKNDVEEEFL